MVVSLDVARLRRLFGRTAPGHVMRNKRRVPGAPDEPAVKRVVSLHLGVGPEELTPDVSLTDDLAADSLDLAELATEVVERARPQAAERRLTLSIEGSCTVLGDRDRLKQLIANLVENAVRYTPEEGRVSVSTQSRSGEVLVIVTNTGEGIPAADLPRVFERFYRVEKSRDRARGGAGIGLAIVKRLVELGGGSVGVESANGLTRFWFSLPRVT